MTINLTNVTEFYYEVVRVADYFIENTSHLSIEALQEHDPSLEVIASNMRKLATIVKVLSSDSFDDENMALNALQCAHVMEQIARAVQNTDEVELERLMVKLKSHSNVP